MDQQKMEPIISIKIPDFKAVQIPPIPSSDPSDSGFSSPTLSASSSPQQSQSPPPQNTESEIATSDELQTTKCMGSDSSPAPVQDHQESKNYSDYLHFCMNNSDGCEEKLCLADMYVHLQSCPFKPVFPCFLDQRKESCSWRLKESLRPRSLVVLTEHFETEHQVICLTVPTVDFTGILTLPCYSAHTGFQQALSEIPSFIATHILWYQNTLLLFAMRLLKEHVEVWLWDLEGQWVNNRRNLQLLCQLWTPPGAVQGPQWEEREVIEDVLLEPKLEPVPVEFDMSGQVVIPKNGVVAFTYRDIYECGIVPWIQSGDVDWFQIKVDLF